jgi:hypothetical protein
MKHMVKKIVAWDFDGPINYAGNHRNRKTRIIHSESRPDNYEGDFPHDIVVNNFEFLQLTLNILSASNVRSIIASQRIHMPDDEHYGARTRDMYKALDKLFGKKRKFLLQSAGEEIGHPLRGVETGKTKVPILEAILHKYKRRKKSNIILIDDHADSYKDTAEQAGYRFIHAPRDNRSNNFNDYQDSIYLFQVLVQAVRVPDIYASIAQMPKTTATNTFKKCLLHYQLDNLTDVRDAQAELIRAEHPHYQHSVSVVESLDAVEQAAKDILTGIQHTIFDTKWELGFFGGEKIIDATTGLKNTIPKNMRYILDEIEKAKAGQIHWLDALKTAEQLGKTASVNTHSFFNRRGDTSQLFYDSFHQTNYVTKALQKASSAALNSDVAEERDRPGVSR